MIELRVCDRYVVISGSGLQIQQELASEVSIGGNTEQNGVTQEVRSFFSQISACSGWLLDRLCLQNILLRLGTCRILPDLSNDNTE